MVGNYKRKPWNRYRCQGLLAHIWDDLDIMYAKLVHILFHGTSRAFIRLHCYDIALAGNYGSLYDNTLSLKCKDRIVCVNVKQAHDNCTYLFANIVNRTC